MPQHGPSLSVFCSVTKDTECSTLYLERISSMCFLKDTYYKRREIEVWEKLRGNYGDKKVGMGLTTGSTNSFNIFSKFLRPCSISKFLVGNIFIPHKNKVT